MLEEAEIRQLIRNKLVEVAQRNEVLGTQIEYFLSISGKYARPVLLLLTSQMFCSLSEDHLHAALAIELFHNFTLVHDDIMDDSYLRRNRPTLHVKWGTPKAVLAGDALLILAFKFLHLIEGSYSSYIRQSFANVALDICQGQDFDMDNEQGLQNNNLSLHKYLLTIKLKTATLFGLSMQLGSLLSDVIMPEKSQEFFMIGQNLGMAFQLQDDLFDLYPIPGFGKRVGGDILAGKTTILNIIALKYSSSQQRISLQEAQKIPHSDEKVRTIRAIFDAIGVKDRVKDQIIELHYRSLSQLDGLFAESKNKDRLKAYINSLFKY